MGILHELLNGSILQFSWNLKMVVLSKMAATFVEKVRGILVKLVIQAKIGTSIPTGSLYKLG